LLGRLRLFPRLFHRPTVFKNYRVIWEPARSGMGPARALQHTTPINSGFWRCLRWNEYRLRSAWYYRWSCSPTATAASAATTLEVQSAAAEGDLVVIEISRESW